MWFGLAGAALAGPVKAQLIMDAQTGRVVHHRSGDRAAYPASLTKMMTLYMLFDALDRGEIELDTPMRVSSRAAAQPPSKLYLKAGSTIRVRDAIPALIVRSANDVAVVVAEALAGSEKAFAARMTRKARSLGLEKTVFRNASGLPNSGQVTTARDMAKLARALLHDFGHHYHYFDMDRFRYGGRTFRSHNRVAMNYDGCDGLKTGYIRASGFNVALSAERANQRWIVVVFGGSTWRERDAKARRLLDQVFAGKWGPAAPWQDAVPPLPDRKPSTLALEPPIPPEKPELAQAEMS